MHFLQIFFAGLLLDFGYAVAAQKLQPPVCGPRVHPGNESALPLVKPTQEQLNEARRAGRKYVEELERLEKDLIEKQEQVVKENSPAFILSKLKPHNPAAVAQSKKAAVEEAARRYLSEKLNTTGDKIDLGRNKGDKDLAENRNLVCNLGDQYRSYDGSCNNLNFPNYGQAGTNFKYAMWWPYYSDGISTIRMSNYGNPLPSPRLISASVTINESIYDQDASLMVMQWGQFLDHDLTLTPTATLSNGQSINCCVGTLFGSQPSTPIHPECLPISIPSDDPLYSNANCMNFVRSAFGPINWNDGSWMWTSSARHQINANTHWMDGSQVYGSDASKAFELRDPFSFNGQMKTSFKNGRPMLPLDSSCCSDIYNVACPADASCFLAGDSRVTEQPLLTVMHTIWVREHNRVANEIWMEMPGQSDEFYYQEARRIVIAEMQHITYHEYLPVLLGQKLANKVWNSKGNYQLLSWHDPNPSIFNEFATAAYRMGHSQLKDFIRLYKADDTTSTKSYVLSDSFFRGDFLLDPEFLDNALRGLTKTPVQSVDNCFADSITSELFKSTTPAKKLGLDLVALNIQRGRDHGLNPYMSALTTFVYWDGWSSDESAMFDTLVAVTTPEVIAGLKKVYQSVWDIDLFIGGVTETPIPGALVGPTFGGIIASQFSRLKRLDRFFYDDISGSVSFTARQRAEIRKVSLARIICDNSDGTITKIQPKVFNIPKKENDYKLCDYIPAGINFKKFVADINPAAAG